MKSSLKIALVALLFGVATIPPAARAEDEINVDFFYNNLQSDGDWYKTPEYGYVFQPRVAQQNHDWRPYTDGSWAYTDQGWFWNSNENFGWATYHYGRWTRLKDYGWIWVPGYEWAPAWVAWRGTPEDGSSNAAYQRHSSARLNYVGWAPLPPAASFNAAYGFNGGVDYRYGLAPADYAFVPTAYFGAPYLSPYIVPTFGVYPFWGFTFGFTNTAWVNYGWGGGVWVGGPSFAYVNAYSARPVPYYNIQHVTTVNNFGANLRTPRAANGVMPAFTPRVSQAAATSASPATVKATVPAGQTQSGWNVAQASRTTMARAQAHVRTQAATAALAPASGQQAASLNASRGAATQSNGAAVANNSTAMSGQQKSPRDQLSPENAARVQAAQAARASSAQNAGAKNATLAGRNSATSTAASGTASPHRVSSATSTRRMNSAFASHHSRVTTASRRYSHQTGGRAQVQRGAARPHGTAKAATHPAGRPSG